MIDAGSFLRHISPNGGPSAIAGVTDDQDSKDTLKAQTVRTRSAGDEVQTLGSAARGIRQDDFESVAAAPKTEDASGQLDEGSLELSPARFGCEWGLTDSVPLA